MGHGLQFALLCVCQCATAQALGEGGGADLKAGDGRQLPPEGMGELNSSMQYKISTFQSKQVCLTLG